MEVVAQVFMPNKKLPVTGTATLTDTEVVFYKKSMLIQAMFGAIGSALAGKKEYLRIQTKDIKDVKKDKYKMNKKACYLTLNDGQTYIIAFRRPDKTIEYLQNVTKKPELVL